MNREAIIEELKQTQADYVAAKVHAKRLDEMLGYNCESIEKSLQKKQSESPKQFWIDLDLQSLQTPYSEIVEMINTLNPQAGEVWLDLGAAYGRMGLVLGFLKTDLRFVGFEVVQERVDEGNRILRKWNLTQAVLKQQDLANKEFSLESADLYFIYDFGSRQDIYNVLEKLRYIAKQKPIRVIARGRGVKNWILMDFPWLGAVNPPQHFGNWSLFRS